jgi:hypothetical protein
LSSEKLVSIPPLHIVQGYSYIHAGIDHLGGETAKESIQLKKKKKGIELPHKTPCLMAQTPTAVLS